MRIHPLCARVCSPAVRRDDVLPRCHEEDARSVLPRRRRGALPSSFFFLSLLTNSIFSFVCARLSSTELRSSSREIILTGSSFRLSPLERRRFSTCCDVLVLSVPSSFDSFSTESYLLSFVLRESVSRKTFSSCPFPEFLRTPSFFDISNEERSARDCAPCVIIHRR